ncbi:cholinesterase 2-like isoform X3 [Leptidea sinapis]|uniref:cholinesterase 2-like isoform X3 n=1 Tax=Leptidea sinapis TaxID=189913 RepID=UPI0021C49E20|nr:cholinesterase 2-like isoform X3 [Leptidea sinapis]
MAKILRSCRNLIENQHNNYGYTITTTRKMSNIIVKIKDGLIRGSEKKLHDGTNYYSFKGIRYAQPPLGKLRFKAPIPIKPWEGVQDALEHGPICPQLDIQSREIKTGSEDCLFLNVYTKSLDSSNIPVMVYIHGGGFLSGSGNSDLCGPEFLIQHDVILVTINYRLEMFGFLCLDIPEVPGNAGMRDQVAALEWVQNNISVFGGDSNNVTIFGESAGAASVTYHLVSPMSKRLFHKAIAQSGSCLADWTYTSTSESAARAFKVGKLLGKDTDDPEELLHFLQEVPAINLIGKTLKTLSNDERHRGMPFCFVPVVENKFKSESFLNDDPLTILTRGAVNNVPLMTGYNSQDGIIMLPTELKRLNELRKNPCYLVPKSLHKVIDNEKLIEFADRIMKFYFDNKEIDENHIEKISILQTDLHFSFWAYCFVNNFARYFGPTYFYKFDYDTELNILKNIMGYSQIKGASHVDEIFYLFKNVFNTDIHNDNERARQAIYDVTKLWTDFAKTGNPSSGGDIKWPPYTIQNKEYLIINNSYQVGRYPDQQNIEFWNQLYNEAGLHVSQKMKSNM